MRSWQAAYRGLMAPEFLASLSIDSRGAWWLGRLSSLDASRAVLVLEEPGGIAGFTFVGPADEGGGEVYAIYLDPDRWGRGHGRRLLTASEQTLLDLGHDTGVLWVLDGNQRARAFYEACGWVRDGAWKLEEIGGRQVTELRYLKRLAIPPDEGPAPILK